MLGHTIVHMVHHTQFALSCCSRGDAVVDAPLQVALFFPSWTHALHIRDESNYTTQILALTVHCDACREDEDDHRERDESDEAANGVSHAHASACRLNACACTKEIHVQKKYTYSIFPRGYPSVSFHPTHSSLSRCLSLILEEKSFRVEEIFLCHQGESWQISIENL